MSSEAEDLYGDDSTHPIPVVDALDVFAVRKGGGGTLVIVAATPLVGDERTQRRLLRKIENYLSFIASAEFQTECGQPSVENTEIRISARDADPVILELIERCKAWAEDNNARLSLAVGHEPP